MDNATLYMLIALLFFVEIGVLLVQFQTCTDHVRRKRHAVESKKVQLGKRSEVLEQEIAVLEQKVNNVRHIMSS